MTHLSRSTPFVSAIIFLGFLAGGCGGSKETAKIPSADTLPIIVEHEPCDVTSSSSVKSDTNGDGKPDIVRVMASEREKCRMVDLNHDDKPDSYVYFDDSGHIRRRESDFDRDGRIDEVAYYAAGVVARKDRETNLDGKLDTWDFYEGGKIHHRMRDSDGDGRVDQWWSWPNPDKVECAVIAADHNRDGRPDPHNVIDVCAAAGAATPAGAPGAVAAADAGATLANASSAPPSAGGSSAGAPSATGAADAGPSNPGNPTARPDGGAVATEPKKDAK